MWKAVREHTRIYLVCPWNADRRVISDVDDDDPALALLARWRHGRTIAEVSAMALDGKLRPTTLTFTASLLFFLEDFFDDPGIQHSGPPFRLMCLANYSNTRFSDP
jgi:hypothetical protein